LSVNNTGEQRLSELQAVGYCDVSYAVCCTVTLFELTVVNNWWILMVRSQLFDLRCCCFI